MENESRVWFFWANVATQSDQMQHVRAANLEQNHRICSLLEQLSQQEPRKRLFTERSASRAIFNPLHQDLRWINASTLQNKVWNLQFQSRLHVWWFYDQICSQIFSANITSSNIQTFCSIPAGLFLQEAPQPHFPETGKIGRQTTLWL